MAVTQVLPVNGMGRSKIQMLVATVARTVAGLVTFIILARYLGPAPFGVIAAAIAYSTILGIASDYGLVTYATRAGSADPDKASRIVIDALTTKLVLATALAVAGGIVLVLVQPRAVVPVYALAFLGTVAASFADLCLVRARVANRFDIEAKLVTFASISWLVIVGATAAATHDIFWSAVAYFVSRIGYFAVVFAVLWPRFLKSEGRTRAEDIRSTLRSASSYAADSILTTLSSQIDVVLFGFVMAPAMFGIYQAGGRLVQVVLPFAVVLATVYLPRLVAAKTNDRQNDMRALSRSVTLEFTGLAVLAAAGFAIVGPILTRLLYGERYAALIPLWFGFAAFAMFRLVAAAFGIQLVAHGDIRTRIGSQLVSIAVFVGAALFALPIWGLAASSWVLATSAVAGFGMMAWGVARHSQDRLLIAGVVAAVAACGVALVIASMLY